MSTTLMVNIMMMGSEDQSKALAFLAEKVPLLGKLRQLIDENRNTGTQAYCGQVFGLHENNAYTEENGYDLEYNDGTKNDYFCRRIIDAVAAAPWNHYNAPITLYIDDDAHEQYYVVVFNPCAMQAYEHHIVS